LWRDQVQDVMTRDKKKGNVTNKKRKRKKQDDRHDWFAEAAEAFVGYLFAANNFEVFGRSKWGADLAIHSRKSNFWIRCEVRSLDKKGKPKRKKPAKLKNRAEVIAEVTLEKEYELHVVLTKLDSNGKRLSNKKWEMNSTEKLRDWIIREYARRNNHRKN
jgi:hypothetical protein